MTLLVTDHTESNAWMTVMNEGRSRTDIIEDVNPKICL